MNKTQITAEPGFPQLVISREFDAPRGLVFRGRAPGGAARQTAGRLTARWETESASEAG